MKNKESNLLLRAEEEFAEWFKEKEEAIRNNDEDYHGADQLDVCIDLFREYLVARGILEERADF